MLSSHTAHRELIRTSSSQYLIETTSWLTIDLMTIRSEYRSKTWNSVTTKLTGGCNKGSYSKLRCCTDTFDNPLYHSDSNWFESTFGWINIHNTHIQWRQYFQHTSAYITPWPSTCHPKDLGWLEIWPLPSNFLIKQTFNSDHALRFGISTKPSARKWYKFSRKYRHYRIKHNKSITITWNIQIIVE